MQQITVYHKYNCVQCRMTMQLLDRAGVAYEAIQIEEHPEALADLKARGFASAPVVIVQSEAGEEAWGGFQPAKVNALVKASA